MLHRGHKLRHIENAEEQVLNGKAFLGSEAKEMGLVDDLDAMYSVVSRDYRSTGFYDLSKSKSGSAKEELLTLLQALELNQQSFV